VAGDRANLLASIQGRGIHNLRKVRRAGGFRLLISDALSLLAQTEQAETSDSVDTPAAAPSTHVAGAPADLASTLAAALNQRKGHMRDDSDSERDVRPLCRSDVSDAVRQDDEDW
jgi:hypothetical protein